VRGAVAWCVRGGCVVRGGVEVVVLCVRGVCCGVVLWCCGVVLWCCCVV
jgi:hypothetical protein